MGNAFSASLDDAAITRLFEPESVVRAMLAFERALALAQADAGLLDRGHAGLIAQTCERLDADAQSLVHGSARAGSLALPLIDALKAAVQRQEAAAAACVHWGATSQDTMDSAAALLGQQALRQIDRELALLIERLGALHMAQGQELLLARTLMQPASVSTLGLRLLNWAAPLLRCRQALQRCGDAALRLQLGGAVGTLAAYGGHAAAVVHSTAGHLGLPAAAMPWHTQRDEWARLASELGVLCGALGKMARDVALMSQPEFGEWHEARCKGRGGSSAMPHKHNPVGALVAIAAAQRAPQRVAAVLACMPQEQERSLGLWQAELAEWAALWPLAGGALAALNDAIDGAGFDAPQARRHVDALLEQLGGADLQSLQDAAQRQAAEGWALLHRQHAAMTPWRPL